MVQSTVRHVHSCKSSRQETVMSTSARSRREKHNSDPSQCQQESPASYSHCHRMGTRSRCRTAPGHPTSSRHPHPPTYILAKKSNKKSPKMDVHTHLKLGRNFDYSENAIVLLDWIIKPLPDIRGVCVEGQKLGMDDYWHSAAIVEVVKPTIVVTASGSVYSLQGKINKYCTIDNGFPKDVAKLFTKGFPHNWRQVIQDFYRQLEKSISIAAEISPIKKKKLQLSHRHKLVGTGRKKKTAAVSSHKLQTPDQVQDSIWTPGGILKQKLSTDDVTVTRSGRISLPPLARWTGQCYRRSANSSDIEVTFETDWAKKSLHDTTTQLMQLPKSSLKMFCSPSLSKSFQIPVDPSIKLFGGKLNQTVDVLGNIDECSPVATDVVIRKKSAETLMAAREITQEGSGNNTRPGVSNSHQKSAKLNKAKKKNRCVKCSNTSEQSPAISDVGETLNKPGNHSPGFLNRNSTDGHTKTICDKSLRVVLSRHKLADINTQQGITRVHKLTRLPATSLDTVQDSQSMRRAHKYSSTSRSNVHSDSTHRQSSDSCLQQSSDITHQQSSDSCLQQLIDSSLNKSYSKHVRASQSNQQLQADSRELTDSSSTEVQQRQVKTRSKITEHKMSALGQRSVRYDRTDGTPVATGKASKTASQSASGVSLLSSTQLTQLAAASKRKQVSATRKRKRDAKDCAAKDETAGNDTTVGRKSNKRRKVMDVTSAGQVSWSQEEQDFLHRALKEVNVADSSYWEKVSAIVATRSQTECQHFYRQYLEAKGSKKHSQVSNICHKQRDKDKTGRNKGEPIRGGKGTLKRKQDLRQFLQEQNEGYEDNLFEGTPFVNRNKQSTLFNVNVDKNDSEIFGLNHNCITPIASSSAISTPGAFLRAKMVSVKKTPQSEHVMVLDNTPVSFNRRKADQYIKSFIDRQRKAEPGPAVVQNDTSTLNLSNLPVRSLFYPAIHPSIVIDSHNTEEEEEHHGNDEHSPYMYYWNDEN